MFVVSIVSCCFLFVSFFFEHLPYKQKTKGNWSKNHSYATSIHFSAKTGFMCSVLLSSFNHSWSSNNVTLLCTDIQRESNHRRKNKWLKWIFWSLFSFFFSFAVVFHSLCQIYICGIVEYLFKIAACWLFRYYQPTNNTIWNTIFTLWCALFTWKL